MSSKERRFTVQGPGNKISTSKSLNSRMSVSNNLNYKENVSTNLKFPRDNNYLKSRNGSKGPMRKSYSSDFAKRVSDIKKKNENIGKRNSNLVSSNSESTFKFKIKSPRSSSYKKVRSSITPHKFSNFEAKVPSLYSLDKKIIQLERAQKILDEQLQKRIPNEKILTNSMLLKYSLELSNQKNYCTPPSHNGNGNSEKSISPLLSDVKMSADPIKKEEILGIRVVQRLLDEMKDDFHEEILNDCAFWEQVSSNVSSNKRMAQIMKHFKGKFSEYYTKASLKNLMDRIKSIISEYLVVPVSSVRRSYAEFKKIYEESSNYKKKLRNFAK